MFSFVVFFLGLGSIGAVTILSIAPRFVDGFEFWPPPSTESWQHRVFRILFRTFFICLIVLSYLEFEPLDAWRYVVGGGLLVVGFGLALLWTGYLGWNNAFGDDAGLKTKGPFSLSRNPIYMASMVGMFGWACLANSLFVNTLLSVWAVLYLAAPFVEEPWMRSRYGKQFTEYTGTVPRYIAVRPAMNSMLSALELKTPPLLIILVCGGSIYWLAEAFRHEELLTLPYRTGVAVCLLVLAAAILITALRAFRIHETTMNPLSPADASKIVTTSIYKYTRNPMYLSMFLVLLAWVMYMGQLIGLAMLPLYVFAIARLQIQPEERILKEMFGEEYIRYCEKTSRWLNVNFV